MRQLDNPESKKMQNKHLLSIAPLILTVQILACVLFLGMIWGPWKQSSISCHFIDFKCGKGSIPHRVIPDETLVQA